MKISQDIIDQITSQMDIVDYISESVPLKKAGANFKGLCPFHSEKSPSFVVSPQKQIFHCFGCHAGGDVIGFVMKYDRLNFLEAIEKLANRLHIPLPESNVQSEKEKDAKEIYYRINAYAHWFFREQFKNSKFAQDYLKSRNIHSETAEKFELGFAPDSFHSLLDFFQGKKVPLEKAAELGLIKKSKKTGKYYDFFRNRLMFPIWSQQGKIIGFGGRALADNKDEAKYLNSPESPVYFKSRELYGLYQNKREIYQKSSVVVVEGYVDVIACSQLGLHYAVAPLGTSFTGEQAKILKKCADHVIFMFDGDAAGKKASVKAFQTCLDLKIHPKVVALNAGEDPGCFLEKQSDSNELNVKVEKAAEAMEWFLASALENMGSSTTEKAKTLKILMNWISKLPDQVERMAFHNKLTQFFDVSTKDLHKGIENTKKFDRVAPRGLAPLAWEELLVLSLVKHPEVFQQIDELLQDFYLENKELNQLLEFLKKYFKKQETFQNLPSISHVPEALKPIYSKLLAYFDEYDHVNVESVLKQGQRQLTKQRYKAMTAKILKAEMQKDVSLQLELLRKKQEILKQKKTGKSSQ